MAVENLLEIEDVVITTTRGVRLSVVNLFVHITLYDGLWANAASGEMSLKDSTRLSELGTLFGNEKLTITYKDVPNNRRIERTFIMFGNMGKIPNANQKGTFSTYSFVSFEAAQNSALRFSKTYRGSAREIISEIWEVDAEFSQGQADAPTKDLIVPDDLPDTHFVFCATRWSPFFTIRWLLSKLNQEGKTDWIFFEIPPTKEYNGKEYKKGAFVVDSLSRLSKNPIRHCYDFGLSTLDNRPESQYLAAAHYSMGPYDALRNLHHGMYAARTLSHDITNREWRLKNYSYVEEFEKSDHTDNFPLVNKLSSLMWATKFDAHSNLVASSTNQFTELFTLFNKDTIPINPSNEAPKEDYIMHRNSQIRQLLYGPSINLALHGNSGIVSGHLLNFEVPLAGVQTASEIDDRYLSGKYIVSSVAHTFNQIKFMTNITIAKNSIPVQHPGAWVADDPEQIVANKGTDGRSAGVEGKEIASGHFEEGNNPPAHG